MSRALAHRLTRLARQARARDLPTWPEVHAAEERLRTSALAHVDALLTGQEPPGRDETQARADATIIERWCAAQGTRVDWKQAAEEFDARLKTMAARYAADPPQCILARSPR